QAGQVPGVGGRGVDHGVGCRQGLVVEQAGYARAALIQQVVTHQYQGQAGGADVLLRAGVDQAKAGDIQELGQNVGGGVAHQRDIDLGNVVILQPANGFVGGVVQVGGIGGERDFRLARHPGVAVGFAAACRVDGET